MVIDNVVINKSLAIERCLKRIHDEYNGNQLVLFENLTKQESIILNIQRICELCIDLGAHILKKKQLGVPQTSRDTFDLLCSGSFIGAELAATMKRMVGFRNIAIHEYQKLDMNVVRSIIEKHLSDIGDFVDDMKKA